MHLEPASRTVENVMKLNHAAVMGDGTEINVN